MQKGLVIGGAFGAVLVIASVVFYNKNRSDDDSRRQADTDAKIKQLQDQLNQQRAGIPVTPTVNAPASTSASGSDSFTQRQAFARQVIDEGFKKLNTRDPKQVADAVRIFQEGIDKAEPDPQFYNGLGRSLLVLGKYHDSLAAFEKGEKLDPKISDMISGQGWDYWNLKEYPAAKEKWEQALKVNPKSVDAWSAMAWIYLGLGQRDRSLEGFNFLIFDSHMDRDDWKIGRTMAAASNTDIKQISVYFPMPQPQAFTRPAP